MSEENMPKNAAASESHESSATEAAAPQSAPAQPAAPVGKPAGADKKIAAGICGILLGWLGIHKFVLGYTKEGIIMLLLGTVGILLLGLGPMIVGIIGLIEGIMYLTKSDEEFVATYVDGKKGWF